MNPLVSVIVPTFNRRPYLQQCIDSILAQTYQPVELIVVDDGSTDETGHFVTERYAQKVRYVPMSHTGLPAAARNKGIREAKGDYLAFCDSDDFWLPTKLETQVRRMITGNHNCSCSNAYVAEGGGRRYSEGYAFKYRSNVRELLWNNYFITSSVVLNRNVLRGKEFSGVKSLRGYEDYVFWLSIVRRISIDFIDEPLLFYRRHDASLSEESRRRDSHVQLLILLSEPIYLLHPVIWLRKVVRYTYHALK